MFLAISAALRFNLVEAGLSHHACTSDRLGNYSCPDSRSASGAPVTNAPVIGWDFRFQIVVFKVANIDQTFLDNSSKTRFAGSTFQIAVGSYYDQRNLFA